MGRNLVNWIGFSCVQDLGTSGQLQRSRRWLESIQARKHSDHRPVLLKVLALDYGPTPFKCFDTWLEMPVFNEIVTRAYEDANVSGPLTSASCLN